MAGDPRLLRWSTIALDPEAWLEREMAQSRGPSRAVCLADEERALGRVALRLPEFASGAVRCEALLESDRPAGELSYWLVPEARGRGIALAAVRRLLDSVVDRAELRSVILDIELDNGPSLRLAERLGAQRREPTRTEIDRSGTPRTLAVHVLRMEPG